MAETITSTSESVADIIRDNPELEFSPDDNPDISPEELGAEPTKEPKPKDPTERPIRGAVTRRIAKITSEKYQLRDQLQAAQARLAELERGNSHQAQPAAHEAEISEPTEQVQERVNRDAAENEQRGQLERYAKRLHEGLAEAGISVAQAGKVNVPNAVVPALLQLENGPEISIYLARHPEDCQLLMNMSEHQAIAYVGRIAERLERSEPRQVTAAPPPVKPVGSSSTKSAMSLEDMPQREYNRYRNEQERRSRFR